MTDESRLFFLFMYPKKIWIPAAQSVISPAQAIEIVAAACDASIVSAWQLNSVDMEGWDDHSPIPYTNSLRTRKITLW